MRYRGTSASPYIVFGQDCDTGVFIKNDQGDIGYSLDGIEVSLDQFLDGILKKGHIDMTHKILIHLLRAGK